MPRRITFAKFALRLAAGLFLLAGAAGVYLLGHFFLHLRPLEPLWLGLLVLLPLVVWWSWRSLAGLGPIRGKLAIALRCLTLLFLILALAETHSVRTSENLAVLYLWDRSLSIPPEMEGDRDLREERLKKFLNETIALRGAGKGEDQAGLIVFGKRPRPELPAARVDKFGLHKIRSTIDDTYTDIASAIKLALASFPEGVARRMVIISDGNENLGQAVEQARIAKQNGVEIDVVAVAGGKRLPNEVLVERVEAPSVTEAKARIPIRIVLRSFHPQVVAGSLQLTKISLEMRKVAGREREQPFFEAAPLFETQVKLRPGLNVFFFQQGGVQKDEAYTYEARFVPQWVETPSGKKLEKGLAGDRIENNRASTSVMARGQRAVLLVEPEVGRHQLLADRLQNSKSSLKVVSIDPGRLPNDPTQLAMVLNKFDAVVLANIPCESLTPEQQKVIRTSVHDQGIGLIVVGGDQGFGAGGWQGSEVEKALPVTSDLKSIKVEAKSGLVLVMHASEMAEGNAWQRKIAKLAVERLSPVDMVGLIYWDWQGKFAGHSWHVPFQVVGKNRPGIFRLIDTMTPGDMPDCDPAFIMAYKELTKPEYELGTKHIIFISDGDHWNANPALLWKLRQTKITCTTVCITTHGQTEIKKMAEVAQITGGRAYHIKDPSELPAIYIKESRLVSQAFTHEKRFTPRLMARFGPTEGLGPDLPDLHGFVRTTRRSSPLVNVPIETPKIGEYTFPLLAYWQYGLGKGVAFTSDARTNPGGRAFWDRDWASDPIYSKFWEQTVEWALRPAESGKFLQLTTEQRDGKVRVVVDARDPDNRPITNLRFKTGLTSPSFKERDGRARDLKFEQKNAGVYEAEFPADEVGAFFLNVQAQWEDEKGNTIDDRVRAAVTIPYSPEFSEIDSNTSLLQKLADITGGRVYADDGPTLDAVARAGTVFRPVPLSHHSLQPLWHWFVLLAGVCLFCDVAVRRIAFDPIAVGKKGYELIRQYVLRRPTEAAPAYLERLRSRKAEVGETLEKKKAAARFEAPTIATGPAPGLPDAAAPPSAPARPKKPAAAVGPEKDQEPEDFASRLMRAKKRAMKDRDKEK